MASITPAGYATRLGGFTSTADLLPGIPGFCPTIQAISPVRLRLTRHIIVYDQSAPAMPDAACWWSCPVRLNRGLNQQVFSRCKNEDPGRNAAPTVMSPLLGDGAGSSNQIPRCGGDNCRRHHQYRYLLRYDAPLNTPLTCQGCQLPLSGGLHLHSPSESTAVAHAATPLSVTISKSPASLKQWYSWGKAIGKWLRLIGQGIAALSVPGGLMVAPVVQSPVQPRPGL